MWDFMGHLLVAPVPTFSALAGEPGRCHVQEGGWDTGPPLGFSSLAPRGAALLFPKFSTTWGGGEAPPVPSLCAGRGPKPSCAPTAASPSLGPCRKCRFWGFPHDCGVGLSLMPPQWSPQRPLVQHASPGGKGSPPPPLQAWPYDVKGNETLPRVGAAEPRAREGVSSRK